MHSLKQILLESKEYHKFFIPSSEDHFLFAKYVNALLNSESGGVIYIGINQKNKIIGVFPSVELETIKTLNKNYFLNDFHFLSETLELENKLVLKIAIDSSLIKPQYIKNKESKDVYIVHHSEVVKSNHIIEKSLRYKISNGNCPINLSKEELEIKEIIELNANISLNNLYKVTNLPKKTIDFNLVRLLNWNQINFKIIEGSCYFTLK
jgi:predicted HTH transcriptional regulator